MCDYSILNRKTRDAAVGDKLVVKAFGNGTTGFAPVEEEGLAGYVCTAVCVRPGTELAFDADVQVFETRGLVFTSIKRQIPATTARFRQIDKGKPFTHHDALELANGELTLLTLLVPGQKAIVLQLPAQPKTEAEAKEQERVPVAA
jgi:hypothetical protein